MRRSVSPSLTMLVFDRCRVMADDDDDDDHDVDEDATNDGDDDCDVERFRCGDV